MFVPYESGYSPDPRAVEEDSAHPDDGARVGRNCIVGAGALVTQGTEIPDGSLAFGSPARVRRAMSSDEIGHNRDNALEYVQLAQRELPLRSS